MKKNADELIKQITANKELSEGYIEDILALSERLKNSAEYSEGKKKEKYINAGNEILNKLYDCLDKEINPALAQIFKDYYVKEKELSKN